MTELALLRFGVLEGRILRLLWQFEEVTPTDLHHLLCDGSVPLAAIRVTLDKLHSKRLVHRRQVQRTYYYRAAADRETFLRSLSTQLAEFLGGDTASTLQAALLRTAAVMQGRAETSMKKH